MNNLEKQQNGLFYNSQDIEILSLQENSRKLMKEFNLCDDKLKRQEIMKKWFKKAGKNCYIEPVFFCDFGCNLTLEDNVYINTNCTILDSASVKIGANTMIASGVQICTPYHSTNPNERLKKENECAKPVIIGKNCWICAGAIILPGVTIGDGATVGAGSVVVKDVEKETVVAGNPARVIRKV